MEQNEERRRFARHEYTMPLNLHRIDFQDQYSHARMIDYSKGGLSFFSHEKLTLGHFVYLETEHYDKDSSGLEKQKSFSGSVKWMSPERMEDKTPPGLYRYGIEFH